jgi:hypothetical protein
MVEPNQTLYLTPQNKSDSLSYSSKLHHCFLSQNKKKSIAQPNRVSISHVKTLPWLTFTEQQEKENASAKLDPLISFFKIPPLFPFTD